MVARRWDRAVDGARLLSRWASYHWRRHGGTGGRSRAAAGVEEAMDRDRDRDYDGVPDWQEDENYADEAPIRGPHSPRARMRGGGCALPVALLLTGAMLAARQATRRRG